MSRNRLPSDLPERGVGPPSDVGGRIPGDSGSKHRIPLDPTQRSDSAVRNILLHLLVILERNVEGTIDDLDTEFLHDLRVACRRTRSALTQLKGVLPTETTAPIGAEFKWLGDVTGPLRDLDVLLLAMPTYRALLSPPANTDFDALEKLIRSTRARAHRSVVRALRSDRFGRLVSSWRKTLEAIDQSSAPHASRPTVELANERVTKAHRRVLERGRGLDNDPSAGALHRLRIDVKKLRYLLEFFHNLYPEEDINARIKELKRLQNILGVFNDMEIQSNRLSDFTHELQADSAVGTSSILTLGRLAATLEERQKELRPVFHDAFKEFSSNPVQAAFRRLLSGKAPK